MSTDPYHWAWLPYAKQPFSDEIRELVLTNKLDNMEFVQELVDDLYQLFKVRCHLLFEKKLKQLWVENSYPYQLFFIVGRSWF